MLVSLKDNSALIEFWGASKGCSLFPPRGVGAQER